MTDSGRSAAGTDDSDRGSPPRMPRWVKVAAIVVAVLVLVLIVLQLTGVGGQHGPGRHTMDGTSAPAGIVQQPSATLWGRA